MLDAASWDFDKKARVDSLVVEACDRFGAATAMVGAGREISYGQLLSRSRDVAARLLDAGVGPGAAVASTVANRPDDMVKELGVWLAGGAVVPVHPALPAVAVQRVLRRSGACWSLSCEDDPDVAGTHAGTSRPAPVGLRLRTIEPDSGEPPDPVGEDTALVAFSSGSTGEPKAILLSHAAFANKLMALQSVFEYRAGQRALHVLQMNFTFGQWTSLVTLLTGGVLEMVPKFSPSQVRSRLSRGDVDRVAVVPTMLRMLVGLREPGVGPKLWITGGEPLSAGLGHAVRAYCPGSSITDVYGLSETSTSDLILRAEDYEEGAGTIGTPSPGVACRIDAPPGEAGEIQLRTPFLMSGYLGAPEATRQAAPDGWFRTGDIGRIRPDGRVELVGRVKTMISRGGIKVSPLEIEAVYAQNPAWTDCLAVGVADTVLGQTIHLLVAHPDGPLGAGELREWGRTRLEPGKVPDAFHVVDRIPLGETGKTDRGAAARLAAGGDSPVGDLPDHERAAPYCSVSRPRSL